MKYDNLTMPLGVNEVANLLNVKPDTVSAWQLRKIFPLPDAYINDKKTRVWKLQTVFDWAKSTGRNNRNFVNYSECGAYLKRSEFQAGGGRSTSNPTNIEDIGLYDDSKLI